MADELLKRIEAPQLNTAGYGNNISEQFNLIDLNFQSLANSDFFTGAQGKGLRLIKVETKSNPGLSPVFTFSENLKAHEDSILNNTDGEKLKRSIKDAFTNYIPSNTTWYADKEYTLYIEEPNNTVHNVYPIICMTEYEDVNGNKNQNNEYLDFGYEGSKLVLKPSSGFPSLYFDTTLGKFCWLINGRESGIAAQGSDGKNGERGPGLDFDVIEAETVPSDKDSFYKIKRVFWKNRMQRFYLNLSDADKVLGTDGKTVDYDEYDVEWLYGGREEWINNNKNRTFLVSRHIEEVKGEDGVTVVKPAENVIHLCKLIKKTAQRIAASNDGIDINISKDPISSPGVVDGPPEISDVERLSDDIVVDEENTSPVLMSAAVPPPSISPTSINQSYISAIVKPPVFQFDFDTTAKNQFEQEYKEVSTSVSSIVAGKVDAIQFVNVSTGKIETTELSGADKAQLATQVANYAEDIYGVYLTDENVHILSSTISAGSSSGISIAFDDMRWDQSNTSALRCMYLNDEGENKTSGILLYNKTVGGPELHLRHVENVGNFSKGNTDINRPEPDSRSGANLNLGTGKLEAESIKLSGEISVNKIKLSGDGKAEIKFDVDSTTLNISNLGSVTVNGSEFTKNSATNNGTITTDTITTDTITTDTIKSNGVLNVGDNIVISSNSNLHIDYRDVIKLSSASGSFDGNFTNQLKLCGVKYYINIPKVIHNFMTRKSIPNTDGMTYTYIGANYNLRIRKVGKITNDADKYKITGYIDFDGTTGADDIGHMVIDTYFDFDHNDNTVSIPYRADQTTDEDSKWALPFAGFTMPNDVLVELNKLENKDAYNVSNQAICLSSMSGPYMSFESVIVGKDKKTPDTLKERTLELPQNYRSISDGAHEELYAADGFSGSGETVVYRDSQDDSYTLNAGDGDNTTVHVFPATFASPYQNISNIPVYNKSVWITKTSYTPE